MKKLNYIDTSSLWEEMSAIAQEAVSDIERVLTDVEVDGIPTSFGTIFYEDEEAYIQKGDDEPQPLRERDTQEILYIADEINDFINNYNKE